MDIEALKKYTYRRVADVEQKETYNVGLSIVDSLKRKYNTIRNLADYCAKFPQLKSYLRDEIKLLEIGAGDGIALNEIKQLFKIETIVTNLEKGQIENSFEASAADLPFSDNYFDLVIAVHSITWEPDQRKGIDEVYRVLKPGGTGLINLFPFAEISTFWFGQSFWDNFPLNEYSKLNQFDQTNYENKKEYNVRVEVVPAEFEPITNSFFLQINKI